MVDESSSMNGNDPLDQSFKATYALIEEVEAKLDDFNDLNKNYIQTYTRLAAQYKTFILQAQQTK